MRQHARISYVNDQDPLPRKMVVKSIERLSGQRKLEKLCNQVLDDADQLEESVWQETLDRLNVTVDYDSKQLSKVPAQGPVLFIANHPFGVLDGLIICSLAQKTREDFKILIHRDLCFIEEIKQHLLPIDFAETREASLINIDSSKKALRTMQNGGAVVIFPAGGISTSMNGWGPATDLEWKLFAAKMIRKAKATVIPIYFHGQNSRLFQIASQFSLTLRYSLMIREVNKRKGETLQVSVGDPIPYENLADLKSKNDLIKHLRRVTYALSNAPQKRQEFYMQASVPPKY